MFRRSEHVIVLYSTYLNDSYSLQLAELCRFVVRCSYTSLACECTGHSRRDSGRLSVSLWAVYAGPCTAPCQSRWGSAVAWHGSISPLWCTFFCTPSQSCPISTLSASRSAAVLLPVCLIWDFLKIMLLFQASSRIPTRPCSAFFPFCLNVTLLCWDIQGIFWRAVHEQNFDSILISITTVVRHLCSLKLLGKSHKKGSVMSYMHAWKMI